MFKWIKSLFSAPVPEATPAEPVTKVDFDLAGPVTESRPVSLAKTEPMVAPPAPKVEVVVTPFVPEKPAKKSKPKSKGDAGKKTSEPAATSKPKSGAKPAHKGPKPTNPKKK